MGGDQQEWTDTGSELYKIELAAIIAPAADSRYF